MSFVRPEAAEAIRRFAEPAFYAAVAGFCLWKGVVLLAGSSWIGLAPLALGALAAFATIGTVERALVARRAVRAGPGVVSVQEGRISYLGPYGGASMAVDALVRVEIVTPGAAARDGARWVLTDESGARLVIPESAANAGALLDVLGALPGFNNMAVVLAFRAEGASRAQIWRRARTAGSLP